MDTTNNKWQIKYHFHDDYLSTYFYFNESKLQFKTRTIFYWTLILTNPIIYENKQLKINEQSLEINQMTVGTRISNIPF